MEGRGSCLSLKQKGQYLVLQYDKDKISLCSRSSIGWVETHKNLGFLRSEFLVYPLHV